MNTNMYRREFLLSTLAAGTALGAGKKKWTMKLSTSSIHFSKLKVEDAIARIAGLGFEGIDIWCPFRGSTHLTEVEERLGSEGLKALLARHKLKLNAFSVYSGGYEKYAELLGASGGGVAVRGSTRACEPSELTTRMKAFIESLKPLVELAEKHNSYLAIENHGNALLYSYDSLKAFVDLNPYKHLGIALAPYHLMGANVPVPDAIRTVGSQMLFFYAWQKAKGLEQLPGHGPLDFVPVLQALAEIDFPRYVNPFMHHEPEPEVMAPALKKSREYLLNCYQKIV